jgi:hypothetical protein
MKKLMILLLLAAVPVAAQLSTSAVKTWVQEFNHDDSFARAVAYEKFEKEIPAADRAAAWIQIYDASIRTSEARKTLLVYLLSRDSAAAPWNETIAARLKNGRWEHDCRCAFVGVTRSR